MEVREGGWGCKTDVVVVVALALVIFGDEGTGAVICSKQLEGQEEEEEDTQGRASRTRSQTSPWSSSTRVRKSQFAVKNAVCCKWKTRTSGVFDCDFHFCSREWSGLRQANTQKGRLIHGE